MLAVRAVHGRLSDRKPAASRATDDRELEAGIPGGDDVNGTIHFDHTGVKFVVHHAACGPSVYAVRTTRNPAEVTCGNCRRTMIFRAAYREATT